MYNCFVTVVTLCMNTLVFKVLFLIMCVCVYLCGYMCVNTGPTEEVPPGAVTTNGSKSHEVGTTNQMDPLQKY